MTSEKCSALLARRKKLEHGLKERTWRLFDFEYPGEAECWNEMYRICKESNWISCTFCYCTEAEHIEGTREVFCRGCLKKYSFTANNFFKGTKKPRAMMAAIYFLESGVQISPSNIMHRLGGAYSSAWGRNAKLNLLLVRRMNPDECLEIPTVLMKDLFGCRSRRTPALEHPVAEQIEMEKDTLGTVQPILNYSEIGGMHHSSLDEAVEIKSIMPSQSDISEFNKTNELSEDASANLPSDLSPEDLEVYELITNKPTSFDTLADLSGMKAGQLGASLTFLELAGLIALSFGDHYVRCKKSKTLSIGRKTATPTWEQSLDQLKISKALVEKAAIVINDFIEDVHEVHHKISRKNLQLYFAGYWCRKDGKRWGRGALLKECLGSRPIGRLEIEHYVTPLFAQVFVGSAA